MEMMGTQGEPCWRIVPFVALFLLLTLSACTDVATSTPMLTPTVTRASTPTPEPVYDVEVAKAEVAAARALWEFNGSDHYTIEYGAFLYLSWVPIRLTVRNGVIESATFLEGRDAGMPVPPNAMWAVLTIDGLFDEIERVLGRPAWNMSAEYDAELGYPRDFGVSYTNTPDDYFAASICCYKPLAHPPPTMPPATSTLSQDLGKRRASSDLRLLPADGTQAAWSPDGSRIAIYEPGYTLYTMSRDGTDMRVLAEKDANGNLVPVSHTE